MTPVDTSVLVTFFDLDDRRHMDARATVAATRPLLIGAEVLVETLGVVKAKAGRPASEAVLEALMRLPNVEWSQESNIVETHRIYRSERALSFVDASVVELSVRRRQQPLTYDRRQTRVVQRMLSS